jgi:predicted transcriptional regulator
MNKLKFDLWIDVMSSLDVYRTTQEISYNMNITYSHLFIIINLLYNNKYVTFEKIGREKHIILTEKGLKIVLKIRELKELL